MSEEDNAKARTGSPEAGVTRGGAFSAVAIGQKLKYTRTERRTALELIECIGAVGVDGDGGDEPRGVASAEGEYRVVGHAEPGHGQGTPRGIVRQVLSENNGAIEARAGDMREERGVECRIEPTVKMHRIDAGLTQEEACLQTIPCRAQLKGTSITRRAIADEVDMTVKAHA